MVAPGCWRNLHGGSVGGLLAGRWAIQVMPERFQQTRFMLQL